MNDNEITPAARTDSGTASVRRLKRREHSRHGPRKPRTPLTYNDAEWLVIVRAAARDGVQPGSFVSQAALDVARMRVSGQVLDRELLTRLLEAINHHSVQLAKIGGNLNDVARHANSTHEIETVGAEALAIMAIVRRRVAMAHGLQAALRDALR
ncbi:MobC family plasmid mobilization relaxosome protein [Saccharothrix sp. AJ9571]|nr:MobC family plasmid mobilization relaxosome protein [Saccharothrix sp. AJ9571]